MSANPPSDSTAREDYILDGSILGQFAIRNYKNYVAAPLAPMVVLFGQANTVGSNITVAQVTLPANQIGPWRLKGIHVVQIPPPGVSVTAPNIYNYIQITIQQSGQPAFTVFAEPTNPTVSWTRDRQYTGEDALYQLIPNATTVITMIVTNQATYTAFNANLVFDGPLIVE